MKNPLQNKAVVIALVVVAAACIAGSFVEWPSRTPVVAAAREANPPLPIKDEVFEVPARPAILERLAGTLAPPSFAERRDPFAWPRTQTAISTNSGSMTHFVVSAISVDGDKAFAVINRQVVSRGDKLGEFVIDQILPNQVWLRGPQGRILLTLSRSH